MAEHSKLPLNALRAFEAVAAHLSFTDAARSLHVTTAAISSHIKSLEEFLETPLFVRHSRSVRLTPQGARLLPGVQRGLGELTRAVDQLRQDRTSGLLNISLLGSFLQKWLLPRLGDFYQKYPDVDLRFNASRDDILWYYRQMLTLLEARDPTSLAAELRRTLDELTAKIGTTTNAGGHGGGPPR